MFEEIQYSLAEMSFHVLTGRFGWFGNWSLDLWMILIPFVAVMTRRLWFRVFGHGEMYSTSLWEVHNLVEIRQGHGGQEKGVEITISNSRAFTLSQGVTR